MKVSVPNWASLGRTTRGVTLFKTAEDENVVSVTRIREADAGENAESANETSPDNQAESAADSTAAE